MRKRLGIKYGIENSKRLWKEALSAIACGTQTFSKMPERFVEGVYPVYLTKGKGCIVEDADGNRYIDYPLALGPVILGYNYERINKAIKDQLKEGIIFSLPHPLEIELVNEIKSCVPSAEIVRLTKTGSEATSAAIRIARAFTGRDKVLCCGYHGWHEWYIASNDLFSKGIPAAYKENILPFTYNKIDTLDKMFEEHKDGVACVIMEPIGLALPKDNFLQDVRELTHKYKALLVFDETITSFRIAPGGAQEFFDVIPDISILGKAMANGMPLAAVAGKHEIMEMCNKIFFSSTFAGEVLSIRAGLETIKEIKEKKVCEHINRMGNRLMHRFNEIAKRIDIKIEFKVYRAGQSLVVSQYDDQKENSLLKALFWQETVKRGILFGGLQYISFSHREEEIDYTLEVCEECLKIVKRCVKEGNITKHLKGKPPRPVFAR